MGIPDTSFLSGDVYIDFPYEEVMFRHEKATGSIYRRFYGDSAEAAISHDSKLFAEARSAGTLVTRSDYLSGKPRRTPR